MGVLLDQMLAYDAADAALPNVIGMFEMLDRMTGEGFDPYAYLPDHFHKDRHRLYLARRLGPCLNPSCPMPHKLDHPQPTTT